MSAWDDSHWIDYDARIINVFSGGDKAWIEYEYPQVWYVGWRRILEDTEDGVSRILQIATGAKQSNWLVRVRVTNASGPGGTAEITAIQTK
jgi:hypothetical protein